MKITHYFCDDCGEPLLNYKPSDAYENEMSKVRLEKSVRYILTFKVRGDACVQCRMSNLWELTKDLTVKGGEVK